MKVTVKDLCFMAFYVALFMVLDTFINALQIFQMPNGGSLGVSVIALLMASYHLGWEKGLVVALLSVFAQFITGPMYTPDIVGFLLDYLLAFSAYGLASIFPNFGWFYSGVLITNFIRFLCSTISGVVVWDTALWGSIGYQCSYMIPTTILTLIIVPILYNSLKPILNKNH